MPTRSFLLSLARECVGKPPSTTFLYESTDSLPWQQPDPQVTPMDLLTAPAVLDPITPIRQLFPGTMWTDDTLIVPTVSAGDVMDVYNVYSQCEVSLDIPCVSQYAGGLKPTLKPPLQNALDKLAAYAGVFIGVTSNFVLHMYGTKNAVDYGKYKLFVLLNHFYGYSISRLELPLSQQPLIAGPNRQHLLTLFQQTGVNVYMPPLTGAASSVNLNEVYLAGDRTQVVIAKKLLTDVVISKTENFVAECSISPFVRDALIQWRSGDIEEIMRHNATFIQMPKMTTESATLVRFMGTSKRSIESTIDSFTKLCGAVYIVELKFQPHPNVMTQVAAKKCNSMISDQGTVIYGPADHVKGALESIKGAQGLGSAPTCVLMEQPVELMDFILGKKQGKISKVMTAARVRITVEKLHELNFRLRISGPDLSSVLQAVHLMEDELPAEKSLYIPEVYHKQVIGQGGQAIQMLMRKYNVYMRFANTTKDKTPNAFGDSRSENVIIRCPAKNRAQIDRAAGELQQLIIDLANKHHFAHVRLSRNHRRLLLSTQSNALRDAEVAAGAAITLPRGETREIQFVEVSGQTEENTQQATKILAQLLPPTDYEFRIPWSSHFATAVGPQSHFSERVTTPLFLAMSAQVQAFERVQMEEDSSLYSQIVVSVQEEFEGELFDDISEIITSYLRQHNLDIADKGKLRSEIIVESQPLNAVPLTSTPNACTPLSRAARRTPGFTKRVSEQAPQALQLTQSHQRPQLSALPGILSSQRANITSDNSVQTLTPRGLPARPPMAPLQWNRNYDETPVKKRNLDVEAARNALDAQMRQRRPGKSEIFYNGRTLHRY